MSVPIEAKDLPKFRVEASTVHSSADIESDWCKLQERSDCSFFQSWSWIGVWLDQVVLDLNPIVVKVWSDDILVGLGLFVGKYFQRRFFVNSNAMFLNEYPFDGRNMVVEYNGMLADRDCQCEVYEATINYLLKSKPKIDEFYFNAVSDDNCLKEFPVANIFSADVVMLSEAQTWIVDMRQFGEGLDLFLNTLSKNKRSQIRRSIRLYEDGGTLKLEEATSIEDAMRLFNELKDVHTERWRLKGLPGVFANTRWERFHREVINRNFSKGIIQLLKVSSPKGPIGYLYNFIWRKRVYMLQSGFLMEKDHRLMPGYVVHALAIAYNKKNGMYEYDFMFGDSRYKESLCNKCGHLGWVVVQRHRFKFVVEKLAVSLYRLGKALIDRK